MSKLSTVLYAVVGLLHLLPALGVSSAARLERMYGVSIEGADMALLLRHRATLFAIVGGVLLIAAFTPSLRAIAFGVGLISMASFVVLGLPISELNDPLRRVWFADCIGLLLLCGAAAIDKWSSA